MKNTFLLKKLTRIFPRILPMLLFGLGILLTGCEKKPAQKASEEALPTLVIAINAGDEGAAIASMAKKYPHAKIEIVELAYTTLREKLNLTLSSSRSVYDVVLIDDPWYSELESKLAQFSGIPPALESDLIPACLALGKSAQGQLKALPFVGNCQLLFYRKDLLNEWGLNAPPTDWNTVLSLGGKVSGSDSNVYCIRGKSGAPLVSDFLPILWATGADIYDGEPAYSRASMNTPSALEALRTYKELMRLSPRGGLNYDWTEMTAAFIKGKCALELNWPAAVKNIDREITRDTNGERKWGVALPPRGRAKTTSMSGNWLLAMPASSKSKGASEKFILWLMENQNEAAQFGNPPTRKSVFKMLHEKDPNAYFYYPTLATALENSTPRPRTARWSRMEDAISIYLTKFLSHEISEDKTLQELNNALLEISKN